MRRAGCARLYMGLESANRRVLQLMDKGTTPERMASILKMCHDAGIAVEAGVFDGFPSETSAEAEETYRFIRDHRHVLTRADVGSFRLLKGAPIAESPERYGITLEDEPKKRWYHLRYTDPTPRALADSEPSAVEKIQSMYPEVSFVDVPEDILYVAARGPHEFQKLFGDAAHTSDAPLPLADDRLVRLSPEFELQEARVTNSGAVHFDGLADRDAQARPVFEWSETRLPIAVDVRRAGYYPLLRAEVALVLDLVSGPRSYGEIRARALDQRRSTDAAEFHRAMNRLFERGVVCVDEAPLRSPPAERGSGA
jgi:hypothetical protein